MDAYIPESITINVIVISIIICTIVSAAVGFLISFFEVELSAVPKRGAKNAAILFAFGFPVALVAYISGYLATMSRATAIGTLLPSVLALIGGLNIYVFGSDNKYKFIISYCICLFAVMVFYGSQYGAYKREADREFRLTALIRQELRLKIIRKNLQLDPDFPTWMVGGEPK